jgi:mycothiol S-conjugate amidase
MVASVNDQLRLLCVHAHPDDESSKGAPTVAKYHSEGVHCVLACCTGGEEGDILNPAMDRPEVVANLTEIRARELQNASQVIGYDEVVMLGYRDSGMPGSPANANPASFARAPLEEATERLVGVVRRVKPHVMVIYPAHQSTYPHPDHVRVHEVGLAAFLAAGDPEAFPAAGPAWRPVKLYYTLRSSKRWVAWASKLKELGRQLPWDDERLEVISKAPHEEVTTEVDVSPWAHVRQAALRAHETQVDPSSSFWFGLPPEVEAELGQVDEYHLAFDRSGSELPETDLFAGIKEQARL